MKVLAVSTLLIAGLLIAGPCLGQTGSKTQKALPKAAKPAPEDVSKPPATPSEEDEEDITTTTADALFPAVVARIDGKPIFGRDLERLVRRELATIGSPEWKNLREDYRGQLVAEGLATLINSHLLYQKAIASGIKVTDLEVQARFQEIARNFKSDAEMNIALASELMDRAALEKQIRQDLAIAKYVEENINKKITVSAEELAKYYSSNPSEFQHPDIVRTSHILIQPAGDTPEQDAIAKKRAEALLARAKKGEDFAKLAKENSMDESASRGGDIGFASKEGLPAEYAQAAFSLPVGGVALVKTQAGYHVIKVTAKKSAGLSTLEEVKSELTEFLKNQKAQEELVKHINQLRDQAKIEILIPSGRPLNP